MAGKIENIEFNQGRLKILYTCIKIGVALFFAQL